MSLTVLKIIAVDLQQKGCKGPFFIKNVLWFSVVALAASIGKRAMVGEGVSDDSVGTMLGRHLRQIYTWKNFLLKEKVPTSQSSAHVVISLISIPTGDWEECYRAFSLQEKPAWKHCWTPLQPYRLHLFTHPRLQGLVWGRSKALSISHPHSSSTIRRKTWKTLT